MSDVMAVYAYVNPLVAVFLGAWLADEVLNTRILVAGLIIISSVVLINQTKSRPRVSKRKKAQVPVVK